MSYISRKFEAAEVVDTVCDQYLTAKDIQEDLGIFVSAGLFEYRGIASSLSAKRVGPTSIGLSQVSDVNWPVKQDRPAKYLKRKIA